MEEVLEYTQDELTSIVQVAWAEGAHTSLHNALNLVKVHRNEYPECTLDNIVDLLSELVEVSREMKGGGDDTM